MHIVPDIHGDVVVVNRVVHHQIPAGVAVAQVGCAHELSVRNVDQPVGDGYADLHVLYFIPPLILVRPPDAGARLLACGVDPGMAGRIFAESDGAKSTRFDRMTRVVEVDGVLSACFQGLWEVDEDCASIAPVAEPMPVEKYFVALQSGMEIELDAVAILQHSEANSVFALKIF